ncbi:hypothetical protein ACQ4PT_036414 [Festuca glaucescens]
MDVLAALREIFLGCCQHFGGLNNAYITLLPKRDGAVNMSDHRPISLVHSFAKLLAKILASRLAPRMDELVDRNQSAFIRGRCIQDNFILVQQSARLLFHKRVPMLMLKLDFARAFDSVSWPFLLSVLRQRGFGPRWIRWISMLLGTATTCPIGALPCKYLGLPLSVSKLCKQEVQLILDRLANLLAAWKAKLMSMDGRLVFLQAVMTSSIVYQLMALDLEPWAKWIWALKTDSSRARHGLLIDVNQLECDVFDASTMIAVGDGAQVLFWDNPWINGVSARCIAPAVVNMVRPSVSRKLSVHDGLVGNHWASTISGELSVDATIQFLKLWDAVHATATGNGPDSFRWKWTADGTFTTRSAYRAFFAGRTILAGAAQI